MSQLHGGNIYHHARVLGIPLDGIIDFSASINPLGPSRAAMKAMREALPLLVNYPDPQYSVLKEAIAERYGIPRESILIGNGSTELIYLLPRALNPVTALLPAPTFSDYGRALELSGCKVQSFPLREPEGFIPDMAMFGRTAMGCDIAFFCNPNNPTGALTGRAELMRLAHETHEAGAFLVIDEAFMDYCQEESVIREAARSENIAVLRNFTKFHAMPGMRVGYLVSHPWIIRKLEAVREPWSVNVLGERAAAASLADTEYEAKSLAVNRTEREFLSNALNALPGLEAMPSAANFLLVKLMDGRKADDLAGSLAADGILIRSCSNFAGLEGEFVRIAVKSRRDNKKLLASLSAIISSR